MFCQNWDIFWTHLNLKWYIIVYLHIQYCISAWDGAADCFFKPIVCMQKREIRYVCCLPALTTTNPLFKKTGVLKLNDVYKLQICKLMHNTITGFDVEQNRFTLASSVHSHNIRFSRKINFINKRPRRLGLNCFRYLGPKFWCTFKNLKNIVSKLRFF